MKTGPPPLGRVAVERELAHDEHGAVHVGQPEVHLVVGVGEEAKPRNLVGHPRELLGRVRVREPDEQEESPADQARHPALDFHLGPRDPLEQYAHDRVE